MLAKDLHCRGEAAQSEGDGDDLDSSSSPFWTVDELAKYLRLNRKTVYALIRQDKIPGTKRFKGHIRVYIPAVLEWAATDNQQKRR